MSLHPVQALQAEALELCGLTYDRAFALDSDENNIKMELNELIVVKLIDIFYNKVYADPDQWFRYNM